MPIMPPPLGPLELPRRFPTRHLAALRELDARVRESIWIAPVCERQILSREINGRDDLIVCGFYDPATGLVAVNAPQLVSMSATHELLHRVNPAWSERTVGAWTTRLVHARTEAETAAFYAEWSAACRQAA